MTGRMQIALVAALLVATALLGALRAPVPSLPGTASPVPAPDAPPPDPYDPSADLAALAERSPWSARVRGGAGAAGPVRAELPAGPLAPWRVVGILRRADGPVALVLFQPQNRLEHRRVGDTLPDGRRIADIQPASIVVEAGGVTSTLPLFTGLR